MLGVFIGVMNIRVKLVLLLSSCVEFWLMKL